jgi:hypothetical protein
VEAQGDVREGEDARGGDERDVEAEEGGDVWAYLLLFHRGHGDQADGVLVSGVGGWSGLKSGGAGDRCRSQSDAACNEG